MPKWRRILFLAISLLPGFFLGNTTPRFQASSDTPTGTAQQIGGIGSLRAPEPAQLPPNLQPQREEIMAAWRAAVASHDAGKQDQAVREIGSWPSYKLDFVATQICELSSGLAKSHSSDRVKEAHDLGLSDEEATRGNANRVLKRGALLLADIGVLATDSTAGFTPGAIQVVFDDGREQGRRRQSHYWAVARRLLGAVNPSPSKDDMVRQWYLATAADLQSRREWSEALRHLDQALKVFPSDSRFLLHAGAIHEFYAGPIVQNLVLDAPNAYIEIGSREKELKLAQFYFQRAVNTDPGSTEAHFRLGHISAVLGHHTKALAELNHAAPTLTDPPLRYLAALFLGQEYQKQGDYAAARGQYEIAAKFYPGAQTPRLALNYLLRWNLQAPRAGNEIEKIFGGSDSTLDPEDPWWSFDLCHVRDADVLMAGMRNTLGGLPR